MNQPQFQPGHLHRAVLIWIIASILGIVFVALVFPRAPAVPINASDKSSDITVTVLLFTLVAIPVFMGVVVFTLYSVIVFRTQGRPRSDGPAIHDNTRFEGLWIIASSVLVLILLIWGLVFLARVDAAPAGQPLQVEVQGEQWQWNYVYPQYGNASSNILELPVNRPVKFTLSSVDVTHGFWIPNFAIKEDANPGVVTHIFVTPTRLGTYPVRCAELCGLYHAYMEGQLHVVNAAEFANWVAKQPPGQFFPQQPSTGSIPVGPMIAALREAD